MSFTKYEGLGTPNQVLQKMRDYIHQEGFTIVDDIKDDLDIFDRNITDGKKLVFKDKTDNYFVSLRSMEGYQIFPEMAGGVTNPSNSTLPTQTSGRFSGIGCIASDGYSPTNRWYEQYLAPKKYGTNTVVGSCLKMAGETPKIVAMPSFNLEIKSKVVQEGNNTYNVQYPFIGYNHSKTFIDFLDINKNKAIYNPVRDNLNIVGRLYWELSSANSQLMQQAYTDLDNLVASNKITSPLNNTSGETLLFYPLDLKFNNDVILTNPIGLCACFLKDRLNGKDIINGYLTMSNAFISKVGNNSYIVNLNKTYNEFASDPANDKYITGIYDTASLTSNLNLVLPNSVAFVKIGIKAFGEYTNSQSFFYQLRTSSVYRINNVLTSPPSNFFAIGEEVFANNLIGVDINITNQSQNVTYLNPSTLYCNHITQPTDTLIFTLVDEEDKINNHLIIGNLNKYANWEGGIFISGSHNSYNVSNEVYSPTSFLWNMPVLGTTDVGATTFCRINVDEAPSRAGIYWASNGQPNTGSGAYCYTGKQLVTPIRYGSAISSTWTAKIPHYGYLQSRSSVDAGVNSNTLNCISMNLPIYFAVKVDPDSLNNFAPIGEVSGVYLVSLLNMASASSYEVSYPTSGNLHQVFSMNRRRGLFGFDGISIKQEVNE